MVSEWFLVSARFLIVSDGFCKFLLISHGVWFLYGFYEFLMVSHDL